MYVAGCAGLCAKRSVVVGSAVQCALLSALNIVCGSGPTVKKIRLDLPAFIEQFMSSGTNQII